MDTAQSVAGMNDLHLSLGAALAQDGIPLHYGDLRAEYRAALETAVLMDRSHEGRFIVSGSDRLALMHRMSTNDLEALREGEGCGTIFTNANARILDRAVVYHRGETAFVLTEPGRGDALRGYLQRNIFFGDDVHIADLATSTRAFALHGPAVDTILTEIAPLLGQPAAGRYPVISVGLANAEVIIARARPVTGSCAVIIAPVEAAAAVFKAILDAGRPRGLIPAGSLTYNAIRIRAGRPAAGRELSGEYIPLEVGLWDEVSFSKGCYTGQEIIARMESRGKLARTIVTLKLDAPVNAPAPLLSDGRMIGTLTSSAQMPDGDVLGIGVVKVAAAQVGARLIAGEAIGAQITALAGAQPPMTRDISDVGGSEA